MCRVMVPAQLQRQVPRRRSNSRFRQEVPPDLRRVLTRKAGGGLAEGREGGGSS